MSLSQNWTLKGLSAGVYKSLYTGDTVIQSCWYFRPSFVNCWPSSLLCGSTLPPPFPVWISILYTRIQCVRGGYGVMGQFYYMTTFWIAFYESYLSMVQSITSEACTMYTWCVLGLLIYGLLVHELEITTSFLHVFLIYPEESHPSFLTYSKVLE